MKITARFKSAFLTISLLFLFLPNQIFALTSGVLAPEATGFKPVDIGPSIDKATGAFNWSLPVMVVPGRGGLNSTITLGYKAGIKTHEEAGPVGLGWSLAPGAIYRTTSYIPDDYYGKPVKTHKQGSGSDFYVNIHGIGYSYTRSGIEVDKGYRLSMGTLFSRVFNLGIGFTYSWINYSKEWNVFGFIHFADPQAYGGWDGGCQYGCYRREYHNPNPNTTALTYPMEPPMDNYTVNGPGPSGVIIPRRPHYQFGQWDNNGLFLDGPVEFHFASRHLTSKIEFALDTTDKTIQKFVITGENGTKYVYGYPSSIRYSANIGANATSNPSDYSTFELKGSYPYAWFLTEILSPDYVVADNKVPNLPHPPPGFVCPTDPLSTSFCPPDDRDKGNWIRFEYNADSTDYVFSEPFTDWHEAPYVNGNNQWVRSFGTKDLVHLTQITTPTHKAVFNTGTRQDALESNATISSPGDLTNLSSRERPQRINSIDLYTLYPSESLKESVSFGYDYSLRPQTPNSVAATGGSLTLKSLTFNDKLGGTVSNYTFAYNGTNPSWGLRKWDRWGYYCASCSDRSHNTDNGTDAAAWSLTNITYPTGGAVAISYEGNSFKKRHTISETPQWGGGIRVKDITLTDNVDHIYTSKKSMYLYDTRDDAPSTHDLNYTSGVIGYRMPPPHTNQAHPDYNHPYGNSCRAFVCKRCCHRRLLPSSC